MGNPFTPNQAEQEVLNRIAAQRERLRARRALRKALAAQAVATGHPPPDAPWFTKAISMARENPSLVAAAAGVALAVGPRRLARWARVALPIVLSATAKRR
ncbi:MAG: hypothetical protein QM740_21760 [Acidovorax sp.]